MAAFLVVMQYTTESEQVVQRCYYFTDSKNAEFKKQQMENEEMPIDGLDVKVKIIMLHHGDAFSLLH